MLHSKIYYMELPDSKACAFIGSHNVTSFALTGLNGEAGIFSLLRQRGIVLKQGITFTLRSQAGSSRSKPSRPRCTFFFSGTLPANPWEALERVSSNDAKYTCTALGAENLRANLEIKVNWRIESTPRPTLLKVPSAILRPSPSSGMQQVHAQIERPSVTPYEYLFEREKTSWWPTFSNREELFPENETEEDFAVQDVRWQQRSDAGWKLVTHLEKVKGRHKKRINSLLS